MRFITITLVCIAVILSPTAASSKSDGQLVILIRHAEKESKKPDAGLTPVGVERAKALVAALRDTKIDHIISTNFKRTLLTAAPVAEANGIEPVIVDTDGELDEHFKAVAAAVRSLSGTILVVGHSNTIPHIVTALGGPELPDMADTEHATMFILNLRTADDVHLIRVRYGAADPE